jgi:hypothetical protein
VIENRHLQCEFFGACVSIVIVTVHVSVMICVLNSILMNCTYNHVYMLTYYSPHVCLIFPLICMYLRKYQFVYACVCMSAYMNVCVYVSMRMCVLYVVRTVRALKEFKRSLIPLQSPYLLI